MNNQKDPKQVLADLKKLVEDGLVQEEEVLSVLKTESIARKPSTANLQQLFYFIGGFIVILGVGILVGQAWSQWQQVTKVMFALGLSAVFYFLGYYFLHSARKLLVFGKVAFLLFAFLLPLGIGTFFDFINISAAGPIGQTLISAILFIIYFVSFLYLSGSVKEMFYLFSVAAASGLFISFTNLFLHLSGMAFEQYRILFLGIAFFLLTYYTKQTSFTKNFLYTASTFMILMSTFSLSNFTTFWLFVYPLVLVGAFYLSVILHSRIVLFISALFTFIEIIRLTTEYFKDSFGWPLALIVAGVAVMLIGYLSFELNKKFLKR